MHCPSCGARNQVAPRVRERAAAQRGIDQATDPTSIAVRHLLSQPGAGRASALLLATSAVSALGWVPVLIGFALMRFDSLGAFEVGLGVFNGLSFEFAAFAVARIALARRRSLQVLTTTFAARPAAHSGEQAAGRVCGGPLPESANPVVRCAYCEAENVIGLDVRPLLRQVEGHRGSVADLLRDQKAERGRFMALGVAGAAAATVGGFWLVIQIAVSAGVAEQREACARGDAAACAESSPPPP
jgi:hypothetical protein